jgi:hypothetical protein
MKFSFSRSLMHAFSEGDEDATGELSGTGHLKFSGLRWISQNKWRVHETGKCF